MGALDKTVAGFVAILAGAYLGAVVWNGNASKLGDELKKEFAFVEFITAVYLLSLVVNYGPKPARQLVSLAVFTSLFIAMGKMDNSALSEFGQGNIGLFQMLKRATGN